MNINKKIIFLTYFIFAMIGSTTTVLDPIIPILSDSLKIGFDKIGLILLAGTLVSLALTMVSGRLSDKFEVNLIIFIGLVILLIGFTALSFSIKLIIFIISFIFFRAGYGIVDAGIHAFISKKFSNNSTHIFIKLDMFHYVGAAIGPLLLSIILFFKLSYKLIFIFLAIFFIVAIILWLLIRKSSNIYDVAKDDFQNDGNNISIFNILKDKKIILLGLIVFFTDGALFGMSTWYTTYSSVFHVPIIIGSLIVSLYWGFSIFGLMFSSYLIKKFSEINVILFISTVAFICVLIFNFINISIIKIIFLILSAVFLTGIFPISLALGVKEKPDVGGSILGFIISAAVAGIMLFQQIMGIVAEYIGKSFVMYVALISDFIALIFIFVLHRFLVNKSNQTTIKKY